MVLCIGEDWLEIYDAPTGRRPMWVRRPFRRPPDRPAIWQAHWFATVDGITDGVDLNTGTLDELTAR